MPAGCDFICENEDCEHCSKGTVITGPWPIAKIEKVINAPNVKEKVEFKKEIIDLKNKGRKFACITYPNVSDIKIEGYRIHKWCDNCPAVWMYDVLLTQEADTLEKALEIAELPSECPQCKNKLLNFEELLEEGMYCPHCKQEMEQSRWMSKEYDDETVQRYGKPNNVSEA